MVLTQRETEYLQFLAKSVAQYGFFLLFHSNYVLSVNCIRKGEVANIDWSGEIGGVYYVCVGGRCVFEAENWWVAVEKLAEVLSEHYEVII